MTYVSGTWRTEELEPNRTDPGEKSWTVSLATAAASAGPEAHLAAGELKEGFIAGTASVNGAAIHHVRGGRGPALVLLHGFPQD